MQVRCLTTQRSFIRVSTNEKTSCMDRTEPLPLVRLRQDVVSGRKRSNRPIPESPTYPSESPTGHRPAVNPITLWQWQGALSSTSLWYRKMSQCKLLTQESRAKSFSSMGSDIKFQRCLQSNDNMRSLTASRNSPWSSRSDSL